jgi:tripartite-type tricarboxylate transporter receptor subunit TctC
MEDVMSKNNVINYLSLLLLTAFISPSIAQTYPTKPIRMIVPFAPGGGTDLVARAVSQRISGGLGVSVIVDNRPGASANIGNELVAKAIPDGYTILMTSSSVTINPSLFKNLGYDPVRDFSPISNATFVPYVLVVHPSVGVSTLKELVQLARTKKGQLTYGSAGAGNATHLGMELLKYVAKIDMVHVPYKGTGQAITDLLGAHIQLIWATIPPAIPHIKSGRLKALAVGSPKRARALPDVATTEELGFKGVEAASWFGMLAPAKTPRPIIVRLNSETVKALSSPDFAEQLSSEGAEPAGNSPEEFAVFIKAQVQKWREVVKIAGVEAK